VRHDLPDDLHAPCRAPNQHAPCMAYTLQAQQTYTTYTLRTYTFRVFLSDP